MALTAGVTLVNAVGHLANIGQFAEIGQSHIYQKEQMQWARRAYGLDSRALRIDLLNSVKDDVRDHHSVHSGRIDTLLLVHTLLLTFALATLQYSDEFVPQSGCEECAEEMHPWLVICWVYSVGAILILPFWSMVMLIWCKLQLDRWLELSLSKLNLELRISLATQPVVPQAPTDYKAEESNGHEMLEVVEEAVARLSGFVVEHQDSFKKIWGRECRAMTNAAIVFLWVSAVVAISITAGMFWLFLENHMRGAHDSAGTHFAWLMVSGLLTPAVYLLIRPFWQRIAGYMHPEPTSEDFEDCMEGCTPGLLAGSCGDGSGLRPELFGELLSRHSSVMEDERSISSSSGKLQLGRRLRRLFSRDDARWLEMSDMEHR